MKRVGVREFRDHATKYLAGNEPLAIERYGDTIGFYIPTGVGQRDEKAEAERRAKMAVAFARLENTIQEILERSGMSEDEFASYFDTSEPLPEHPLPTAAARNESGHASGS